MNTVKYIVIFWAAIALCPCVKKADTARGLTVDIFKKLHIANILLSLCIFCGCSQKHTDTIAKRHIDVFLDGYQKPNPLLLSSIVDSVTTVCLDFPDSIPLGCFDSFKFINHRFYLFDRKRNGIYIFDESGDFVRLFLKVGHAKDEYISIEGYDVNPFTNEISIYDVSTRKMKRYDSEDHLVSESKMEDVVRDFVALPSGDYLFYTPDKMKGNRRGLWKTDSSCHFKEQLVEIPNDYFCEAIYPYYFRRVNDTTIGIMDGANLDRIYHVTDNGVEFACQIHVDRKVPKWIRKQELIDFELYKDKIYMKMCYIETADLLMFFVTDTETIIWVFCNKNTGEVWQGQPSDIVDDVSFTVATNYNDFLLGCTMTDEGDMKIPIFTTAKK